MGEPKVNSGECVRSVLARGIQSWVLERCETMLPFMCRAPACPAGTALCANGRCINKVGPGVEKKFRILLTSVPIKYASIRCAQELKRLQNVTDFCTYKICINKVDTRIEKTSECY